MRISLSREAQADADAAVDWYTGENAFIAADEFANELDRALGLLNRFPELGHASDRSTRTLALHSFPYSLIYRLQGHLIRVIAVAHHSRRPGYWVRRR
ncbi:MAG: type II toxin-antitoxin system RelE/ParE family toxin [Burkholderiales bacterium]|nr:type II toxin-antitoxin system RelE/ParE family toxin [Burkholderiales bacterium]